LRPHSVQVKDVSDGNAQWFVVVFHFALPLRPLAQLPRSKGFFGQFRRVMLLFAALVPFQA
jgi:hypothetical protein